MSSAAVVIDALRVKNYIYLANRRGTLRNIDINFNSNSRAFVEIEKARFRREKVALLYAHKERIRIGRANEHFGKVAQTYCVRFKVVRLLGMTRRLAVSKICIVPC